MDEARVREEAKRIGETARKGGYGLNPDETFVEGLVEGILVNRDRYGYDSCPCRLATGQARVDRPIVCPCDYRDEDLADFDACYCALYVTDGYRGDDNPVVPDRWNPDEPSSPSVAAADATAPFGEAAAQVCNVCGYIALKEKAPRKCPVCGATHDRFRTVRIALREV